MTREELLDWADKIGADKSLYAEVWDSGYEAGVSAEREACARVCDELVFEAEDADKRTSAFDKWMVEAGEKIIKRTSKYIAEEIRARGEK